MFDNYNTNKHKIPMQPNSTTTENNTERIQQIISSWRYDEEEQSLNLCTLVFTQVVVVMIGGVCWSPGTGLHSALST